MVSTMDCRLLRTNRWSKSDLAGRCCVTRTMVTYCFALISVKQILRVDRRTELSACTVAADHRRSSKSPFIATHSTRPVRWLTSVLSWKQTCPRVHPKFTVDVIT